MGNTKEYERIREVSESEPLENAHKEDTVYVVYEIAKRMAYITIPPFQLKEPDEIIKNSIALKLTKKLKKYCPFPVVLPA